MRTRPPSGGRRQRPERSSTHRQGRTGGFEPLIPPQASLTPNCLRSEGALASPLPIPQGGRAMDRRAIPVFGGGAWNEVPYREGRPLRQYGIARRHRSPPRGLVTSTDDERFGASWDLRQRARNQAPASLPRPLACRRRRPRTPPPVHGRHVRDGYRRLDVPVYCRGFPPLVARSTATPDGRGDRRAGFRFHESTLTRWSGFAPAFMLPLFPVDEHPFEEYPLCLLT